MKIVITGASKGIGKAIAAQFAHDGHQVLLCSRG
ncbi:SDR family NAD(P)-dependent oxidoreductase, partial [Parvimonas micra]